MLIKQFDRFEPDIRRLRGLLDLELDAEQRLRAEAALRRLSGRSPAGPSPAQMLDFYCADSPDWAVLHHLRLAGNGGAVLLDHLLINRRLEVVLVNTDCFYHDLKIGVEGDFRLFDGRRYRAIESPLEKNRRRLSRLAQAFEEHILAPCRLGVPLRPRLSAVVLLCPGRGALRPPSSILDTRAVVGADRFLRDLMRRPRGLVRRLSATTLKQVARQLAELHQPAAIDLADEVGLSLGLEGPPAVRRLAAAGSRGLPEPLAGAGD